MPVDPILVAKFPLLDGLTAWSDIATPEQTARVREWDSDPVPYVKPEVTARDVAMEHAGHPFRVRVYGAGDGSAPCLVWSHGGAFVAGDLDMNEADVVAREIVVRAGAVVVSVDYTLAPAVHYPVLHEQVAAAWSWTAAHADELGVDASRITIGGASAGAALSLAATRALVEQGTVPSALILAYPVAHAGWDHDPALETELAVLPPVLRFETGPTTDVNQLYLGGHPEPRLAYLGPDGEGVAGLPPTYVVVCEYDDLRPSGELFVAQARAAGVRVEATMARGLVHGHLNRTPVLPQVDATLHDMARVVVDADVRV